MNNSMDTDNKSLNEFWADGEGFPLETQTAEKWNTFSKLYFKM